MYQPDSLSDTVRAAPIRVVRVVVVDVATVVHVPLIVRVSTIARAQEHVHSGGTDIAYSRYKVRYPCICLYLIHASVQWQSAEPAPFRPSA